MNEVAVQIKRIPFLLLIFVYFVLSFFGFLFTSSGWHALLICGPGWLIFFFANYLIYYEVIFRKQIALFRFPVKSFVMLIVIQIIALLLNIGDYGDASGARSFFEVILGRSYQSSDYKGPLLGGLATLFALFGNIAYVVALIKFQINALDVKR